MAKSQAMIPIINILSLLNRLILHLGNAVTVSECSFQM